MAEGPAAVREALAGTVDGAPAAHAAAAHAAGVHAAGVIELFATPAARDRFPDLIAAAVAAGVPLTIITDEAAAGLSETVTPQGLVAVCVLPQPDLATVAAGHPSLVVVLADIRDPGNAGTIVRTAAAVGADAVILAGDCVDPYNGKSVRASAGAIFHLPPVRGAGLPQIAAVLGEAGLQVLAADGGGPVDLDGLDADGGLAGPTAWVFGNEAHGLSAEASASAHLRVRIPMSARTESLSVGAAAAICLYASAKAQRAARADDARGHR